MSIRNPRTGRHEDDVLAAAHQNNGQVTLRELIEHLEEIVADAPSYGSNVALPVRAAAELLRSFAADEVDLETLVIVDPQRYRETSH